jgi:hypothetical protein
MTTKPRKRRDSGDLCQLRVELWAGVRVAAAMVDNPKTKPDMKLRAISALATVGAVYARLLETSELVALQERITALEARLQEQGSTNGHHAPYAH